MWLHLVEMCKHALKAENCVTKNKPAKKRVTEKETIAARRAAYRFFAYVLRCTSMVH